MEWRPSIQPSPVRAALGVAALAAALLAGSPARWVAMAPPDPTATSPRSAQLAVSSAPQARVVPHVHVAGGDVPAVDVRCEGGAWKSIPWSDLDREVIAPGRCELRFRVDRGASALRIPVCAGRRAVRIDGRDVVAPPGPLVAALGPGPHEVLVVVQVSGYERRIACGEPPQVGEPFTEVEGLGTLTFASPHASKGGGVAVVYVPRGHDVHRPGPLLVGTHPWNGSMWTYAAYGEMLLEASRRDVLLLLPQGLGNSLYTADAEDEVLRAIDALSAAVAVDSRAISIWGASMGGAGATTIALHHPDHFAMVASFFGDSRYDRATYVGRILRSDAEAHAVNALDVVDNARHLPVWLIHGEEDRTSKIAQSEMLADAMRQRGYVVRFDRVAGAGHDGSLVARFVGDVVDAAADARVPIRVTGVTYRSVRPSDLGAYGVVIERSSSAGDAFVDIEEHDGIVEVRRAEGVRSIRVARGALGTDPARPPSIVFATPDARVDAAWQDR